MYNSLMDCGDEIYEKIMCEVCGGAELSVTEYDKVMYAPWYAKLG